MGYILAGQKLLKSVLMTTQIIEITDEVAITVQNTLRLKK